ncbi:unnamed protein product [Mytilus coruscus]|uniref:Transposase Tc1-like domain-containing protein n=1 Tax=Mytilus coruscus TaxID=42192 RepID=A0A6J8CVD3_MYTCO|nr:unnamed protein product [Mytilus coruscus]
MRSSYKAIGRQMGYHYTVVSRLVRKHIQTNNVKDLPRSGRPLVTSQREDRALQRLIRRMSFATSPVLKREWLPYRQLSTRTFRNRLKSAGLMSRRVIRPPMLTDRHQQLRLAWCLGRRDRVTNKTTWKASSTRNKITIDGLTSSTVYKLIYTTQYTYGTNLPVSFYVTTSTEPKDSVVSNSVVTLVTCSAVGLVGCVLLAIRFKDKLKDICKCLCYKPDIEAPTIPINTISRQELDERNEGKIPEHNNNMADEENDNRPDNAALEKNNGYVQVFGTTNSNHSDSSDLSDDAANSASPLLETAIGNCLHSKNNSENKSFPINECESDRVVEEDQSRDRNECPVHSFHSYVQSDFFVVPSVEQEITDGGKSSISNLEANNINETIDDQVHQEIFPTRCVVHARSCQQIRDDIMDEEEIPNCKVHEHSFYPEDNIKLNSAYECTGNLAEHIANDEHHIKRRSNQNDKVNVLSNHTDAISNQQDMDNITSYVRTEDLHIANFQNQQDVNNASSYVRSDDLQNLDLHFAPSHKGTENLPKIPFCQNRDFFSTCVHTEDLQKYPFQQNLNYVLYSSTELQSNNPHIRDLPPIQNINADESNNVSSESLNQPSQPISDSSSLHDQGDSEGQSNSGYISHEKFVNLS